MSTTVLSLVEGDDLKFRTLAAVVAITATNATPAHARPEPDYNVDNVTIELAQQMRHPMVQPLSYWDRVAVCESSTDGTTARWNDGGRFAGGLGIYVGTWRSYGGADFATTPAKATRLQQIVIANRISVVGFQTRNEYRTLADRLAGRTYYRPAAGFNGWGCVRNHKSLKPKRTKTHGGN